MGVKHKGKSLGDIKSELKARPLSVAHAIAQRTAPTLTALARGSYTSGVNVYGDARPRSTSGKPLKLVKTGATLRDMRFRVSGTLMWCTIGPKYARYLIGKYGILPNGARGVVPVQWTRAIDGVTDGVMKEAGAARVP